MWPALIQIFRPFASLLFYRSYIKNDLADSIQREHEDLSREEAMFLAEQEIKYNRVPALDPLGAFRGPYEDVKKNLGGSWKKFKKIALWTLIIWILGPYVLGFLFLILFIPVS